MLGLFEQFAKLCRRFRRGEDGILTAELVIILPVFVFCFMGIYTYWDGYRSLNNTQKATYTIADLISREQRPLTANYVDGMQGLMEYLINNRYDVDMRISSITYSGVRNRFEVLWSRSPQNKMVELDTDRLQPLADGIPMLADGDSIILVEANLRFKPAFGRSDSFFMFLDDQTFEQFIVTRPRFVPRICLQGVACG